MKRILWRNIAQTAIALGVLCLAWQIAYLAAGNELLVPSFSACLRALRNLLASAGFWQAFLGSFLRALIAFLLSVGLAGVLAVIAYLLPFFEGIVAPVVSALRSLPVMAVLLILLTLFSAGEAPVAVAFLSLFPMLYTAILSALKGIDRQLVEIARVYGAGVGKRIVSLYLPLTAPHILRESGAGLSFSVKLVVSAEILAMTAGSLGGMMWDARAYHETATLFALVGVAFVVGLILELSLSAVATVVEKKIRG